MNGLHDNTNNSKMRDATVAKYKLAKPRYAKVEIATTDLRVKFAARNEMCETATSENNICNTDYRTQKRYFSVRTALGSFLSRKYYHPVGQLRFAQLAKLRFCWKCLAAKLLFRNFIFGKSPVEKCPACKITIFVIFNLENVLEKTAVRNSTFVI